jgi:hypothetical protein
MIGPATLLAPAPEAVAGDFVGSAFAPQALSTRARPATPALIARPVRDQGVGALGREGRWVRRVNVIISTRFRR